MGLFLMDETLPTFTDEGACMKTAVSTLAICALVFYIFVLSAGPAHSAPDCSPGDVHTWKSGFVVRRIVVNNDSNRTLVPPRVRLGFNAVVGVDDSWGATATSDGRTVTLTGSDRNATLAAGSSARFVFKGTGSPGTVTCTVLADGDSAPTPTLLDDASAPPGQSPSVPRSDDTTPVIWRDDEIDAGSPGQKWRGVNDTRIVADCGGERGQCLEVSYVPTDRGSGRLQTAVDIPPGTDYTLLYDIRFGDGFEFVRGGKLPGLAPDVHTTGCKQTSSASWSTRPMWRVEGSAQAYFYGQDRTGNCGDGERSATGAFTPGQWQSVALRVKLNGGESTYDGEVTLVVDGMDVSRNQNVRLRSSIADASEITRFFFSTFYGGADPSWAPTQTTTIRYDDFRVIDNTTTLAR